MAAVASQVAVVGASDASRFRPGTLDSTFGGDGRVTTAFGEDAAVAEGLAVQADGKLVAAGRLVAADRSGVDFAVARYRRDGRLDTDFGTGGRVITDIASSDDFGVDVAAQADGKIVVAGYSFAAGSVNGNFALVRYNPDGTLDASFGDSGRVTTDLHGIDQLQDLVLQEDGKIVAGGTTLYAASTGEVRQDFALVRYNRDGSLDAGFGTGGRVITDLSTNDALGALTVQADGRIVAAGSTSAPIAGLSLVRYRRDGSLDASFGRGGTQTNVAPIAAQAVIEQRNGRLVVAGSRADAAGNAGFGLVRLHHDGSLDTRFGTDGVVTTSFPGLPSALAHGLVEHDDGRLTAAGTASSATGETAAFALAGYRRDGSLDPRFGVDGRVTTTFAGEQNQGSALALQDDDKLVVAGFAGRSDPPFAHFALARYHGRR